MNDLFAPGPAGLIQFFELGRRQQHAMPDRREHCHESHHDIDTGLFLQPETSIGNSGQGIEVQGECPAVSLKVGAGLSHKSPFLIEFNPPHRLTAAVSISNRSSTRPSV